MTQLPATYAAAAEARALSFAREWVASAQQGDFIGLGYAPLHAEAGRAFLRRLMQDAASNNAFAMSDLVECADAGWDDADIALRQLIAELINRGEPLPAVLAAYNIKLVNPRRAAHSPRGPKPATNILQDVAIALLVMELVERFHLRPTRFQIGRKRQPSACSIASAALTEARVRRVGEKAIQAIWGRYEPKVFPGSLAETVYLSMAYYSKNYPLNN